MQTEVPFEQLSSSDLWVDCVYKGGPIINMSAEPISKLVPGCSNSGGFRKVLSRDRKRLAYVVLFSTMNEIEWPDYLDRETGILRYYGDNRKPGSGILDTAKKGNSLLVDVYNKLNTGKFADIPPFLVFQKGTQGKDVKFLGLAVPGTPSLSPDRELTAFWRTKGENRFQNYEAYFSVLDTEEVPILKQWLLDRYNNVPNCDCRAPGAWKLFTFQGRAGIRPLCAKKLIDYPSPYEQLQTNEVGRSVMDTILGYYSDTATPYEFEYCATDIVSKMDPHFIDFKLTRPWRDGGRDALGHYEISTPGVCRSNLKIDCAIEAKCYQPVAKNGKYSHGVGVHEMSRLISRIRHRQFGVMVTTSFISEQAYLEVKEDQHPILMVTATDIAATLQHHGITDEFQTKEWLKSLPDKYMRMI